MSITKILLPEGIKDKPDTLLSDNNRRDLLSMNYSRVGDVLQLIGAIFMANGLIGESRLRDAEKWIREYLAYAMSFERWKTWLEPKIKFFFSFMLKIFLVLFFLYACMLSSVVDVAHYSPSNAKEYFQGIPFIDLPRKLIPDTVRLLFDYWLVIGYVVFIFFILFLGSATKETRINKFVWTILGIALLPNIYFLLVILLIPIGSVIIVIAAPFFLFILLLLVVYFIVLLMLSPYTITDTVVVSLKLSSTILTIGTLLSIIGLILNLIG